MNVNADWKLTLAAATGLGGPDAVSAFFNSIGPLLEGLVRLGQIGVAVVTILYIYRRWKNSKNEKVPKSGGIDDIPADGM